MSPIFYVCVAQAVVIAIMGFRLFKKDTTAAEAFRDNCLTASDNYKSEGFTIIPRIFRDLAIIKPRQFLIDAKAAVKHALEPTAAKEDALKLFEAQLAKKLADPVAVSTLLTTVGKAAKVLGVVAAV